MAHQNQHHWVTGVHLIVLERLLADPELKVALAAQSRKREGEQCLLCGRGEALWRLLIARWGPPVEVDAGPDDEEDRLVCFESQQDGYGGGNLICRRAGAEDFVAPKDPLLFRTVYAFSAQVAAHQRRTAACLRSFLCWL